MNQTSRAPLITAIVLLLLPLLYVGSYLALVVPQGRMVFKATEYFPGHEYLCRYRIDSDVILPALFWPLEQIDRKVRPEAWEITPAPLP
ncbi:hypothetical protein ETAA8_27390 [Anatilimnocola aggregata]|uniref:Uncharacterized protein n=1 Tax=Anatilimnocola aggregata TaxID=2528021 RepID=A0A517YBN4_9BACT|nr:hypothetical protein [Anatilimnocola aggregata]QDU27650.1 hypothetical protein ETAA8_27390 [Anatilimnocola aggregata]